MFSKKNMENINKQRKLSLIAQSNKKRITNTSKSYKITKSDNKKHFELNLISIKIER